MKMLTSVLVILALLTLTESLTAAEIAGADIVRVGNTHWVQADLFIYRSWNDINAVCPSGVCVSGGSLSGYTVTGWHWASVDKVNDLFNHYIGADVMGPGPSVYFDAWDSPWAAAFFEDGWRPTTATTGDFLEIVGWTSTPAPTAGKAYGAALNDWLINYSIDNRAQTNIQTDEDYVAYHYGAFLYRDLYSVDDGGAEASVGGIGLDSSFYWANQFTAPAGGDTITEIHVAFGDPISTSGAGEENGAGVTVGLWDDPNNDGSPDDAVLLASTVGSIASSDTDTFEIFDIPDTIVTGSFFIGVIFTSEPPNGTSQFPAALDQTCDAGNSWRGIGTDISQSPLPNSGSTFAGNWLILAVSTNSMWVNTCANDEDYDGVVDALDNCPMNANPQQPDNDGDGVGNACDEDWILNGC